MPGKKKSTLTARAREMFALIDRYQSSGLTQKAFCAKAGIAVNTFQYWLKRQRAMRQPGKQIGGGNGFAPLSITAAPAIEIDYPNGVHLRLGSADISLLRALIDIRVAE